MIPEKRFLNQIQQVLARLMQPLWLLDTEGTVLLPEENRSKINLPEFMEPGMPVAFEGKTFLMIGITVRNQCLHDKIAKTLVMKR